MSRLVTTTQAAVAAHRRPPTIRWWAHRGLIRTHGSTPAGHPLYDLVEVWRCEHTMSQHRGRPRRPTEDP